MQCAHGTDVHCTASARWRRTTLPCIHGLHTTGGINPSTCEPMSFVPAPPGRYASVSRSPRVVAQLAEACFYVASRSSPAHKKRSTADNDVGHLRGWAPPPAIQETSSIDRASSPLVASPNVPYVVFCHKVVENVRRGENRGAYFHVPEPEQELRRRGTTIMHQRRA